MPRGKRKTSEAFEQVIVFLPKKTVTIIREKSVLEQKPMSRLCAIAIDNELDQGSKAFNYPTEFPETEFVDYQYQQAAGRLCAFLSKFETGTTLETLMLCRRDMGIESREELMGAYRELLVKKIIEEFTPKRTGFYMAGNQKRVRVFKEDLTTDKRRLPLNKLEEKYRGDE